MLCDTRRNAGAERVPSAVRCRRVYATNPNPNPDPNPSPDPYQVRRVYAAVGAALAPRALVAVVSWRDLMSTPRPVR